MLTLLNPYPDERWVDIRATFELVDVDAAEMAMASATSEGEISRITQTHDRNLYMSKKIATLEHNFFVLDGTFELPYEVDNGQVGWWCGNLSDSSGEVLEELEFAFPEPQSSVGFTVMFDDLAGECAEDFAIRTYGEDDSLLSEDIVTGNREVKYISEVPSDGYVRMIITFTKAGPYRYIRVCEVVFGIIQTFNRDNTISLKLLYEASKNMEVLPTSEAILTIDNLEKKYNFINPEGIYQYLQLGQGIDIEMGVGDSKENIRYVNMARFYFTKATAENNSLTAQITGNDLIFSLDRGTYRKGENTTDNLGNIVDEIITDSGLDLPVSIPSEITSRVIGKYIPVCTHRKALKFAAQAARCTCYIDRSGTLVFRDLSIGMIDDILTADELESPAKVNVSEYINKVEVKAYGFVAAEETDILYQGEIQISGTQTIWISRNASEVTGVSVSTGSVTAEHYLYASKLTITASGLVTVTITGYSMTTSETLFTATQLDGNPEYTKSYDNPLIIPTIGQDFADWLLAIEKGRLTYTLDERGNPAREIGDTVGFFNSFTSDAKAILLKQELSYDGALSATATAWEGGK